MWSAPYEMDQIRIGSSRLRVQVMAQLEPFASKLVYPVPVFISANAPKSACLERREGNYGIRLGEAEFGAEDCAYCPKWVPHRGVRRWQLAATGARKRF